MRSAPVAVQALVAAAKAGNAEAFGELYGRYRPQVFRYVQARVTSRPLAEDLTSETFLRALRGIGDFRWMGRDFGGWLVTIARNLILDYYKSSWYRLEISTPEPCNEEPYEGPEAAVIGALASLTLLTAVHGLGSEQRDCVVLRFLQGLSVAETAEVMGKKSGAVKALQYRAVRSLARTLPYETFEAL